MRNYRLILFFSLTVMLTVALTELASAQTVTPAREKSPSASQAQATDDILAAVRAEFPYNKFRYEFSSLYQGGRQRGTKWDGDAREGLRLFDDEQLDQATSHLQRAIAAGCEDPVVLFAYGCCRLNAGDKAQFRANLKEAIKADFDDPKQNRLKWRCFHGLAWLDAVEGNWEEALEYYQQVQPDFFQKSKSKTGTPLFALSVAWERTPPSLTDRLAYWGVADGIALLTISMRYVSDCSMDPKWADNVRLGTLLHLSFRHDRTKFAQVEPALTAALASAITAGCEEPFVHSMYAAARNESDVTDESLRLLERAETMFAEENSYHFERYYLLMHLGEVSERQKDYKSALARYRIAREVYMANNSPEVLPYRVDAKIKKLEPLYLQAQELARGREKAAAKVGENPDDVDALLELARASLAASKVTEAFVQSNEALRLSPDSPAVLVMHMQVLFESGKHESLLNLSRNALPLAIEKGDGESAGQMLHYLRLIVDQRRYRAKEAFCERLKRVQPLKLADQTLRAFPEYPRVVLAYFSLFATLRPEYEDYYPRLNLASSDLQEADFWTHAMPAIETARREKQWETLCGLVELYGYRVCWNAESIELPKYSADRVFWELGIPLRYEELKVKLAKDRPCLAERWRRDDPERFPVWMGEAAAQLKSKTYLGTAFEMLNTICRYPRDDKHFMELRTKMDYFAQLAIDAGMSKSDISDAEATFFTDFAHKWATGIGDDDDLEMMKTHLADRYRQHIIPVIAERDIVADRRSARNPKPRPKRPLKSFSSTTTYSPESYSEVLPRLRQRMKTVIDSRDDATTAKSLRRLRQAFNEAITAGIREDRFSTVLEHAECFHGWAMRNLLATRRPSTPQPTAESSTARTGNKQSRFDLHDRAEREDMHSGAAPKDNQVRDLATEAHIASGPTDWLTTTQGEMQETRPVEPLKTDEIQAMLETDTALLYCHLATFLWFPHRLGFVALVTNNNLKMHSCHTLNLRSGRMGIGKGNTLEGWQQFEGFHDKCVRLQQSLRALREKPPSEGLDENLKKSLRYFYDKLIAPIEKDLPVKHLVIVPSDDLFSIPWALLLDKDGRYLCEKVAISYVPSATVLQFCREKHASLGNRTLVFANPDLADPNYALKFAEQEADVIKECCPKTESYLGASATETDLRKRLMTADIVHLACHAVRNKIDPMASYLALARDEANDGRLSASEIMNLRTNAQLVVLSACESGRGDVSEGQQEIVGMTRAWMFAGASSVVASLWKVDDRATSELMGEFYKNLKTMGRAEALQQAQLTMMKTYDNPYYWGAFVLYGDYR